MRKIPGVWGSAPIFKEGFKFLFPGRRRPVPIGTSVRFFKSIQPISSGP